MSAAEELHDFHFLTALIRNRVGIVLDETKVTLVRARLHRRFEKLGLQDFRQYRAYLESLHDSHPEWQALINAVTTNQTEFFRELKSLEVVYKQILPEMFKKNPSRTVKVWCAACSTGEEAYTLSYLGFQEFGHRAHFEIMASDIDTEVLWKARNGVYSEDRVASLPPDVRKVLLSQGKKDLENWYRIRNPFRAQIKFEQFNLVQFPYPFRETFDVIICRNVLIYFDSEMIKRVAEGFFAAAAPGAVLVTGASESLHHNAGGWRHFAPAVYYKPK